MNSSEHYSIPFPWQQMQWEHIKKLAQSNTLPHSLLFKGQPGLGKLIFAKALAKNLLCEKADVTNACEQCKSCQLFQGGTHPDFKLIEAEETGKAIKVDQIRQVIEFYCKTSQQGGYKIIIINPAEQLNRAAANALLKTLEEPPKGSLLILISSQPMQLLATIRSRCQGVLFNIPSQDAALKWLTEQQANQEDLSLQLQLAQGAPLAVLEMLNSDMAGLSKELYRDLNLLTQQQEFAVNIAKKWAKIDRVVLIDWLIMWLHDIIRKSTASKQLANFEIINFLYDTKRQINSRLNINQGLLLETIFQKIFLNR